MPNDVRPVRSSKISALVLGLALLSTAAACDSKTKDAQEQTNAQTAPTADEVSSDLPGVGTRPADVAKEIEQALQMKQKQKDPIYRTEHTTDEGLPMYTNRLIMESSPYLQQHAHNPVDWFPWGEEAFQKAAEESKPILLSVGYSTCHWCHVMERESFEDKEIATYMNENYIAIKVDREERPDIDDTYMQAVRMMTRRGGWPMTVWLTPDRLPFMGGTYFPPRSGARGARVGFIELLKRMKKKYDEQPSEVAQKAQQIAMQVQRALESESTAAGMPDTGQAMRGAFSHYQRTFDDRYGGFGKGNKFPMPSRFKMLLHYHRRTGDERALDMVTKTLDEMAHAGIYDDVGGGFHRYSTNPQWMVPHFEKMLYDNAQLVSAYTEAWQVTQDPTYERIVRETLDYLIRDMSNDAGALYSATDADSPTPEGHSEEGLFFLWTPDQVNEVLADDQAELVTTYYNITEGGNFEGRTILHTPRSRDAVARELGLSRSEFDAKLERARTKMYHAREQRQHPIRDDKILAAWNGLGMQAFARAGLVFDNPTWTQKAEKIATFVLDEMRRPNGGLMRTRIADKQGPNAFSDDYAFTIAGLLTLYEASHNPRWLAAAVDLQKLHLEHFWDDKNGGFYQTADDAAQLLGRQKSDRDGAVPASNSYAALNLQRLYQFTLDESYNKRAEEIFELFGQRIERAGGGMAMMLVALDFYDEGAKEIAIVKPSPKAANPLIDIYRTSFQPNAVLVVTHEDDAKSLSTQVPWMADKPTRDSQTTGYVCRNFVCKFPTNKPAKFAEQIAETEPLAPQ
jgi:uncharacterized protein YyaL (SSP411 family)